MFWEGVLRRWVEKVGCEGVHCVVVRILTGNILVHKKHTYIKQRDNKRFMGCWLFGCLVCLFTCLWTALRQNSSMCQKDFSRGD